MEKLTRLKTWMKEEGRVVVGFSGGIDSALLVVVARQVLGADMLAVTGDSDSVPSRDRVFVTQFCKQHDVQHKFIKTNEFDLDVFRTNPENRCYYCKGELYRILAQYAKQNGYRSVLDGTNASDLSGHRPGYKAILETDAVKVPYIELEITKSDIRAMAADLDLSIAHKPASACLSSRIPTGEKIEPKDLRQVDHAENILRDMGFSQIRVRHHGKLARIQCLRKEADLAVKLDSSIMDKLKGIGYDFVTLDLKPYGE
jgi:uncharacterized protein